MSDTMILTDEELTRLRRLAEAATPGPWPALCWYGSDDGGWAAVGPYHEQRELDDGSFEYEDDSQGGPVEERAMVDAEFIAAANPTAVLALLDALDLAVAERDEARVSVNSLTEALQGAHERHVAQHAELERLRADVAFLRDLNERDRQSAADALASAHQHQLAAEQERDEARGAFKAADEFRAELVRRLDESVLRERSEVERLRRGGA